MASQDFEIRGYGIEFDHRCGSNTTGEKIRALLALAPQLRNKVNGWLNDCNISPVEANVDDYADFDQDYCNGIPALISMAIMEAEGVGIECHSDLNGCVYLVFPACMPWEYNEKERALSENDIIALLSKYWHMLYEGETDIDRVSIHQYG